MTHSRVFMTRKALVTRSCRQQIRGKEMKTLKAKVGRSVVVVLVGLLGAMTAQSHQDRPNFETLVARGRAIATADPAATELRDQQSDDSARRGFDIGMAVAETDTLPGPGKQRIHDSLPLAEQSGFEVAVKYSLARNRKKLTDLAPRGAELAQLDPLAAELRNQQFNEDARLGFDIGMAAAEGDTADGPGKQKMHDSLAANEKRGFASAVVFSLERNRNAKLAQVGAAIAAVDSQVRAARNTDVNVFYRLGFDIATGIFGDKTQGALGNTLTGPGSLGIRDALGADGRRGFNAGAAFHLGRLRNGTGSATEGARDRGGEVRAVTASDEIRCRGYSLPGGSEYVFFTIDSRPVVSGETVVIYEIAFTPSPRGAGQKGEGLRPGECAWVDRPVGNDGPLRIRFTTVANAQLKQQLHGSQIDRSSTAAERYPDVRTIPIYLKGETHYWSFGGVRDSGRGYFQATGHGYWKPPINVGEVNRSPTERTRP